MTGGGPYGPPQRGTPSQLKGGGCGDRADERQILCRVDRLRQAHITSPGVKALVYFLFETDCELSVRSAVRFLVRLESRVPWYRADAATASMPISE